MPGEEIATLVTDATPFLTAAVTAYGMKVLEDVRDDAAEETVKLGRRLLQRVFGRRKHDEPLPAPLVQVVSAPDDADALGALRLEIRQQLAAHADVLADVRQILASGPAAGRSVTISAGRDSYYSERDMTINRPAD